jgi:serine/alanine adding enzyme
VPDTHLANPRQMQAAALLQQAKLLSRAIGAAKKQGQPIDGLLLQHRSLIDKARALSDDMNVSRATPTPVRNGPPGCAVQDAPDAEILHRPVRVTTSLKQTIQVQAMQASDAADWDDFVQASPNASLYHLSAWQQVCAEAFGHYCPYLIARQGQAIVGVLPLVQLNSWLFGNFLVSMPFFNYGGVLCNSEPARDALLAAAVALARERGSTHLELRDWSALPGWPERTDKITMKLDLPSSAKLLWQALGSKLRAQIKKAQSHGFTFETGGIELLDDFYNVFAHNMRDLGTPVYDRLFFRVLIEAGVGSPKVVVGRDSRGAPVSVALLLRHKCEMEIPWASTLRRVNRQSANMALYWHVLSYACEEQCERFDFGRCTEGSATHRFKKQWGAQPVQLRWHYWMSEGGEPPRLNPDNPKFRLAVAVWKRLPVWLTRLIGPPVVKYLP